MRLCVRGPAVPEQADGDAGREVRHGDKAILGLEHAVLLLLGDEDAVAEDAGYNEAGEGADAETDVGEAYGAGAEVILALEDGGEGGEEEVEVTVADGGEAGGG